MKISFILTSLSVIHAYNLPSPFEQFLINQDEAIQVDSEAHILVKRSIEESLKNSIDLLAIEDIYVSTSQMRLVKRQNTNISGQGRTTYYGEGGSDPAPSQQTPGACGPAFLPPDSRYFVAINHVQFNALVPGGNPNNNPLCGLCVKATCADPNCVQGASTIVYISDMCPGCPNGGLDLSRPAFAEIVGGDANAGALGVTTTSWNIVPCPSSWVAPVSAPQPQPQPMTPSPGASAEGSYYQPPIPAAQPQGAAPAATCTQQYTLVSGDTCNNIAQAVALTLEQFLSINPGIPCDSLQTGSKVCVGSSGVQQQPTQQPQQPPTQQPPTQPQQPASSPAVSSTGLIASCTAYHITVPGEDCTTIASQRGYSLDILLGMNPSLQCSPLSAGIKVCTRTNAISTNSSPCLVAIRVAPGINCANVSEYRMISVNTLVEWNTGLDCANLQAGQVICLGR